MTNKTIEAVTMNRISEEQVKEFISILEKNAEDTKHDVDKERGERDKCMYLSCLYALQELLERRQAEKEQKPVAYIDPVSIDNFDSFREGNLKTNRGREWMWANQDEGLIPLYAEPVLAQQQNNYFSYLVNSARAEADKAIRKYPQPNYVLLKVAEEAGEVVQAGVHYAEGRIAWRLVESEVVQLLAMLIRLVTEGDQVNGVFPPSVAKATGESK